MTDIEIRAIEDAVWQLEQNYPLGALAGLRALLNRNQPLYRLTVPQMSRKD